MAKRAARAVTVGGANEAGFVLSPVALVADKDRRSTSVYIFERCPYTPSTLVVCVGMSVATCACITSLKGIKSRPEASMTGVGLYTWDTSVAVYRV